MKSCSVCNRDFEPTNKRTTRCDDCKTRRRNRIKKECPHCAETFHTTTPPLDGNPVEHSCPSCRLEGKPNVSKRELRGLQRKTEKEAKKAKREREKLLREIEREREEIEARKRERLEHYLKRREYEDKHLESRSKHRILKEYKKTSEKQLTAPGPPEVFWVRLCVTDGAGGLLLPAEDSGLPQEDKKFLHGKYHELRALGFAPEILRTLCPRSILRNRPQPFEVFEHCVEGGIQTDPEVLPEDHNPQRTASMTIGVY